jgi:hypothetical protein
MAMGEKESNQDPVRLIYRFIDLKVSQKKFSP